MTKRVYVISDTHFGHANILTFKTDAGNSLRSFSSVDAMNETMIHKWNSVVRAEDKVYHLGDVSMSPSWLHLVDRLNGDKVLIKGNHDNAKASAYLAHFRDIRSCVVYSGAVLSHIPVHPMNLYRFPYNIHGHTHSNLVTKENGEPDTRYFNACVEHLDYTPILLDEVMERLRDINV